MLMNSTMQDPDFGEPSPMPATASHPVAPETDSDGLSVLVLVPHVAAALLIWALMAITLTGAWKALRWALAATTGPVLSSLLLAAGVCGLISIVTIWWFCNRGSPLRVQGTGTDAGVQAPESESRHHAA
jgi:hypothetical protein